MKKVVLAFLILVGGVSFLTFNNTKTDKEVIGVVVPMHHAALDEIVAGLEEEFSSSKNVTIKVMNAQGDLNIQRACIQQLIREKCSVIVPIGTAASQMTLNLAKDQDVLCLAADREMASFDGQMRATVLDDNLCASASFSFIRTVIPKIKKVTLLYSPSEKVAKEVPIIAQAAKENGIELQSLMVHSMSDLYTVSSAIAPDSEAIFVLKDHLIVSGIQTVAQQAQARQIPVITSDEGSVIAGAAFALGVKEASIGAQGGQIVKQILSGVSSKDIPPLVMEGPFPVFVNRQACERQGICVEDLAQKAQAQSIPVYFTDQD